MLIIIILFIFLFLLLIDKNKKQDFFENNNGVVFNLKLANTKEKQKNGLMYVKNMPENAGMLFKYNNNKNHSMWMKNTFIPLDILFLDKNYKLIDYVENTVPFSLKSISINNPSINIIELNGGSVKKFKLKKNQIINFNIVNFF
jgi:uncharacterized protein